MNRLKKYPLTWLTGFVILAAVLYSMFFQEQWNNEKRVIYSDVQGYYAYLPALFIQDDIKFEHLEKFGGTVWNSETEDGKRFIKYTCGMSIMYSPFFFTAHALADSMGAEPNGYSYPYRFALVMSSFFYTLLGLFFMGRLLLRYFSDSTTSITLLIVYLGTNLWNYATYDMTYSHSYSFALIAIFMYCIVRWLETPSFKWTLWAGLTAGLFVLIRPVDIIFLLFIPLFGITSFKSLVNRFKFFWEQKWKVLMMIGFFIIPFIPQFVYNYHIFGSFLYYSYSNERFFFADPKLYDILFSYRNGWLVYTPIMVLSIIGFFFLRKENKRFLWYSIIAGLIYYFIIASWWCWWYVGFGNRAFVNLYPLLILPVAALVEHICSLQRWKQWFFRGIVATFVVLNLFQTWQFENRAIHWGAMSEAAYWDSFLREEPSQVMSSLLLHPDLPKAHEGKTYAYERYDEVIHDKVNTFDGEAAIDSVYIPFLQDEVALSGTRALHLTEGTEFCMKQPVSIKGMNTVYIRAWVKNAEDFTFVLSAEDSGQLYFGSNEIHHSDGEWDFVHLYAFFPDNKTVEEANLYIWNQSKKECWVDDLQITGINTLYASKPQ